MWKLKLGRAQVLSQLTCIKAKMNYCGTCPALQGIRIVLAKLSHGVLPAPASSEGWLLT